MSRLPSVVSGDSRPGSPGASSFPVPVLLRTDYNPATIKRRRLSADTVRTMSAHHHRLLSVRVLLGLFCSLGLALTTAVLPAPAADAAPAAEGTDAPAKPGDAEAKAPADAAATDAPADAPAEGQDGETAAN